MRKVLIIARREYLAMVGTRAFLIGLIVVPILMFGGIVISRLMERRGEQGDKKVLVIDRSQTLFSVLQQAAQAFNELAAMGTEAGQNPQGRILLEEASLGEITDEQRLELSDRVRRGELHAFVEIPAAILDPPNVAARLAAVTRSPSSAGAAGETPAKVMFYAENAALSDARRWLEKAITEVLRIRRLQAAGVSPDVVAAASIPVETDGRGLYTRSRTGEIRQAEPSDVVAAIFLPLGIMMLMFMTIWMAAQPAMENVLEEKQQRIADVLLGSSTSFQLMVGKLLGGVAGSLTILAIYAVAGYFVAQSNGLADAVPFQLVPIFLVFQILAVLLVSSVFMAVGAAANSPKEAQGLLLPIWLVFMIPFFTWFEAVREPNGAFAVGISLFPPATPMMMMVRLAASTVPTWQVVLGIILVIITTIVSIFVASRIFRIGILAQGTAPSFRQLMLWIAQSGR